MFEGCLKVFFCEKMKEYDEERKQTFNSRNHDIYNKTPGKCQRVDWTRQMLAYRQEQSDNSATTQTPPTPRSDKKPSESLSACSMVRFKG